MGNILPYRQQHHDSPFAMPDAHYLHGLAHQMLAAEYLAAELVVGDLVLLDGPMGAGKTSLVKGLVAALDGDPDLVTSPTFTLLHQYQASIPVIHVDAYRLESGGLLDLGFDELKANAIACVEWPERVVDELDASPRWELRLDHHSPTTRALVITPPADRPTTINERLAQAVGSS